MAIDMTSGFSLCLGHLGYSFMRLWIPINIFVFAEISVEVKHEGQECASMNFWVPPPPPQM